MYIFVDYVKAKKCVFYRSFFFAGLVLSNLLADTQKGLEKIVLDRKKESMRSAR